MQKTLLELHCCNHNSELSQESSCKLTKGNQETKGLSPTLIIPHGFGVVRKTTPLERSLT
jgi:hypothetical protein